MSLKSSVLNAQTVKNISLNNPTEKNDTSFTQIVKSIWMLLTIYSLT